MTAVTYRGASREKCYELFTRLAFRTLVNDYAPTMDSTPHEYELVTTLPALDALVARLTSAQEFALRIVIDDLSAVRAAIVGFTLTVADRQASYVPVGHESGDAGGDLLSAASRPEQLELRTVVERLKPLLEDAGVRKIGHDLKQETILLGRHGVTTARRRVRRDTGQLPARRESLNLGLPVRSSIWATERSTRTASPARA